MGKKTNRLWMSFNDAPPATPTMAGEIRSALQGLRKRYGPQPWLTVASGVVAEAVRLSGMSGQALYDLMRSPSVGIYGSLVLYRTLPGTDPLRTAFDRHTGGITDADGVLGLYLDFDGRNNNGFDADVSYGFASYCERPYSMDEGVHYDRQTIDIGRPDLPPPDVEAMIGRPVAELFPKVPRCVRSGSTRVVGVTYEVDVQCRNIVTATVATHWETLALMPVEVSRELGIPAQSTTDHMPWLAFETPRRESRVIRRRRQPVGS